jgi:sorbitol-specific phosphotransferase system component IIBC
MPYDFSVRAKLHRPTGMMIACVVCGMAAWPGFRGPGAIIILVAGDAKRFKAKAELQPLALVVAYPLLTLGQA